MPPSRRRPVRIAGQAFVTAFVVLGLVGACSTGPGGPPTTATLASPSRSGPASVAVSAPTLLSPPSSASAASPAPARSPAPGNQPPVASLGAEGGDPVDGELGSYTWGDGGSDSPWLQGSPLRVGAGEPLRVTIAGDPAVGDWTVQRVVAGISDGTGAAGLGSGQESPIAFIAPDAGHWSVLVTIRFAGGSDSAAYYWLLDVH